MDDELIERAKRSIALEHGLSEHDANRLVGTTAAELHADAKAMARELGAYDPSERARDEGGKFASGEARSMNQLIRRASGRPA